MAEIADGAPEAGWCVDLTEDQIAATGPDGSVRRLLRRELAAVAIGTDDSGPWGADVWWLLFDLEDELALAFPQGAAGEAEAMDWFLALPAFDHGEMMHAMTSTTQAVFPVWRRPPG